MMLIKKTKNNADGHAQIVGGNLVLSLPHAKSPVVWRWDLTQAKASALEVSEQDNGFDLIMKTSSDGSQKIASFNTRESAVGALMMASEAMNGGQGYSLDRASEGAKWLIALAGALVVIFLFFFLARMTPQEIAPYVASGSSASMAGTNSNPENSAGVPVSADDLLGDIQ